MLDKFKKLCCLIMFMLNMTLLGMLISQSITSTVEGDLTIYDVNLPFYKAQFIKSN